MSSSTNPITPRHASWRALVFTAVWLVAVGAVTVSIIDYSNQAGAQASAPAQWPPDSHLKLSRIEPTLLLFLHPRCPCTRATLSEAEVLLAECRGRVNPILLFIRPGNTTPDWGDTSLWRSASAIPDASALLDTDGIEARRFGCETSGQVLLYSPEGRLLFQGGITSARGHAGDNLSRRTLAALINGSSNPTRAESPVFGCGLFNQCPPGQKELL